MDVTGLIERAVKQHMSTLSLTLPIALRHLLKGSASFGAAISAQQESKS